MSSKPVNQHKRLAMGDTLKGYAKGGRVGLGDPTPIGAGAMVPKPAGRAMSPLTVARRNNGVPGMCMGGKVKK